MSKCHHGELENRCPICSPVTQKQFEQLKNIVTEGSIPLSWLKTQCMCEDTGRCVACQTYEGLSK